jgi:predicted signal transduction protein with EAL and GGDEF domain
MRMQAADVRRDGAECWIETSKIPLKDDQGKVVGVLAVTEDITARKYMEQELFRRANFDSLTGLPNRGYFQSQLDEAVKRAQRRNGLALMYFDIDRFKQINDTYGHDAGDKIIRLFAQRIRSVLRESDFMARLGGDEFVLIAPALLPDAFASNYAPIIPSSRPRATACVRLRVPSLVLILCR